MLECGAERVECCLAAIRIGDFPRAPLARKARNRRRVDVAGGGDATRAAAAQRREQERLAAGEDIEALRLKALEHRARIAPVARAVLDAGDRPRIIPEQALDQREADGYLRHGRNVIEIHTQPGIANTLDDLGVAAEQALVRHTLVVERRQHEHARATEAHGRARELDRVRKRAASRPRHHAFRRQSGIDETLEQRDLLRDGERVRFGVGAEHRKAHALIEEPAAVTDKARCVGAKLRVERRDDGRQDAANARDPGRFGHRELHDRIVHDR